LSRLLVRARSLVWTLPTGVPTLTLGLVVGIAGLTSRWRGTWLGWAWPPIIGLGLGLIYSGLRSRDPLWPGIISAGILGYMRALPLYARDERALLYLRRHPEAVFAVLIAAAPLFAFASGAVACLLAMMVSRRGATPRTGGDSWGLPLAGLVGVLLSLL